MPVAPSPQPTVGNMPPAPDDTTETADEFSTTANDFVEAQVNIVDEYNAQAAWQNTTAQEVYDNAVEVSDNTAITVAASDAAQTAANFLGVWYGLTGSAAIGDKVEHDGAIWVAAVAIADITLSEPSATNSDWIFVSGNTFLKTTTSMNVIPNAKIQVSATSSAVDITLVLMMINDSFTLRNNSDSTETVRLINTTYTIIGNFGFITPSDNLVIKPKETRIFMCRDANVLEIL